jgi:di/tricarboxylate transporter
MPALPDAHALAVIALTVVAFYLFTRNDVPLQTTSLGVLAALTVGFHLWPYATPSGPLKPNTFFLGFGHEALVTIIGLMIIGRGLVVTGALEPVARIFSRALASFPMPAMLAMLVFCAAASSVMNDTPVVVLMMPILIGAAMRAKGSPSQMLLPMNYAVLLGGMGTTIGTSTNLLVVSIAADLGLRPFGMFDFIHVAALAASVGILYLWLVLPHLLPKRDPPLQDTSPRIFSAVLHITEESFANEKTLAEVLKKSGREMRVDRIERGKGVVLAKLPTLTLHAGDRLFVSDTPANLKEYATLLGASLYDTEDLAKKLDLEKPLPTHGQQAAEVIVTEGSLLHNRTLGSIRFAEIYNVIFLALHRTGTNQPTKNLGISNTVLETGDVLLVQGTEDDINKLKQTTGLLVLDQTTDLPHTSKAPVALAVLAAVVVMAATKTIPIAFSALLGVGMLLMTRVIDWKDVGSSLNTRIIMLVAASLALGSALTSTGGTDYLAQLFLAATSGLSPELILGLLMLMTALLTNFVSNNAAAAIGTPIAMSIAHTVGAAPEPFVLAILFGANFCYATPMAYQTNLMVMSAGSYRFSDFIIGGVPLMLLMLVCLSYLLPRFFPL